MQEPVSPIQITLPVRQLVEFLRRAGSIDNRFTGFDRANEGARIHRKLQRAAVKEHADYTGAHKTVILKITIMAFVRRGW